MHREIGDAFAEGFRLEEGRVVVLDEIEAHAAVLEHHSFGTEIFAQATQTHHADEFLSRLGDWTEAVLQATSESLDGVLRLQSVELAIEEHALGSARHIRLGQRHRHIALELTFVDESFARRHLARGHLLGIQFLELVVLQFLDGLGEYLLVGLIAQVGDETALLGTQQVARAAYVEVLHGDVNARTEVGEVLYGLQATAAVLRQSGQGRRHEVAERLLVGAPHTSAHLMQV